MSTSRLTRLKWKLRNQLKDDVRIETVADHLFLDVHKIYDKAFLNWHDVLATNQVLWNDALNNKTNGKKILFATSSGGFSHRPFLTVDSFLAVALTLRGANVDFLLCDHALPACFKAEKEVTEPELIHHAQLQHTLCHGCYEDGVNAYAPLGLTTHRFNQFVTPKERIEAAEIAKAIPYRKIKHYKHAGVAVGEHALAATIRFFARINLAAEPKHVGVLRRYLEAAIITSCAVRNLIAKEHYDTVCLHHGIYVPQGIIAETCKQLGVNVVTWGLAYRQNTFVFTHQDYITINWMKESTTAWENITWSDQHEKAVMNYLESRSRGNQDWIGITKDKENEAFLAVVQRKNIDVTKPIIGLLTNIIWDAQVAYPSRVFKNMIIWLIQTIKYFNKRQDLQLLVRIHPAEASGQKYQQLVLDEINRAFKTLPANVFIIESNEAIDTYDAMKQCDSVIIYATTTGIELAARGVPVIVAGESWIRKKGVAFEANSTKGYWEILDKLPFKAALPAKNTVRAQKLAFHHFFRRMIPVSLLAKRKDYMLYELAINKLDELLPGSDLGLDIICEGILEKKPFFYPAEDTF